MACRDVFFLRRSPIRWALKGGDIVYTRSTPSDLAILTAFLAQNSSHSLSLSGINSDAKNLANARKNRGRLSEVNVPERTTFIPAGSGRFCETASLGRTHTRQHKRLPAVIAELFHKSGYPGGFLVCHRWI
jgi:hypothetical protein